MQALSCREIINAANGTLLCGNIETRFENISTDSRKITGGELFIPLAGEKFDGHDFIGASLNLGAAGSLTHRDADPVPGKALVRVEDTLRALQDIARYYRKKFNIPFVAITGSVGKTSTKNMVASVLGRRFNVLKTTGNLNNEIGLPLTVFNLDGAHEVAVVEMGMSGFGEIERLTSIALPRIAVITNIGLAHIEKLGSRQNILKAKMEILSGLEEGGTVILNGDDRLLYGMKGLTKFHTVYYGIGEELDYQAYNVVSAGEKGTYFEISVGSGDYRVHVPAPGVHNVYNALAAIAAGKCLGVSMEEIIEGIAAFESEKMRMDIISYGGFKIINDAYNANPQSMEAALNVLKDMKGSGRTIAVLGDMLEMGDWACDAHLDTGKFAVSRGIDYIITVGENGGYIAQGALEAGMPHDRVFAFNDKDAAASFARSILSDGDTVLVKGSRAMKMEEIVDKITAGE